MGQLLLRATGDGMAGSGDITVTGSRLAGTTVSLQAEDAITLRSQQETHQEQSHSKSSGGSIGVSANIGTEQAGLTLDLAANMARGNSDGSSLTHTETLVTATEQLTLQSGGDTTLQGAQARGEQITAVVGGNLTLTSEQDQETLSSKNKSMGIGISVPILGAGSVSVSGNYAADKVSLDYQSVNEQTGLYAGAGGFDIQVGGHTALTGAVIASAADAANNRFTTESLSHSNLENRLDWEAEASGLSLSYSAAPGSGPTDKSELRPGMPVQFDDGEHKNGTSQSAIADGVLIVRSDAESGVDSTAGLRRDTSVENAGSLSNSFDQAATQENIELARAQAELGGMVAPIVFKEIGKLSDEFKLEEGSAGKIALHALGGALVAAVGGGDVFSGMGVAGANEWLIGFLDAYVVQQNLSLSESEISALMRAGSLLLGAALDGGQGASIALNATEFNYLSPEHRIAREAAREAERRGGMTGADRANVEAVMDSLDAQEREALKALVSSCDPQVVYGGCADLRNAILKQRDYDLARCPPGSSCYSKQDIAELDVLLSMTGGHGAEPTLILENAIGSGLLVFQGGRWVLRTAIAARGAATAPAASTVAAGLADDVPNSASQAAIRQRVLANVEASASARSTSNINQLDRFETAYDFYRQAGFDADRTLGHLQGIDFTRPVAVTEILPGTKYVQHVLNGRVGNYFAPLGTRAEMLGINPAGRTPLIFAPSQPIPALQSTAARIIDKWTVPSQPFNAAGGGTQFFVPGKGLMIQVPNP